MTVYLVCQWPGCKRKARVIICEMELCEVHRPCIPPLDANQAT